MTSICAGIRCDPRPVSSEGIRDVTQRIVFTASNGLDAQGRSTKTSRSWEKPFSECTLLTKVREVLDEPPTPS